MMLNVSAQDRSRLIFILETHLSKIHSDPLEKYFFLMLALLRDHQKLEESARAAGVMILDRNGE